MLNLAVAILLAGQSTGNDVSAHIDSNGFIGTVDQLAVELSERLGAHVSVDKRLGDEIVFLSARALEDAKVLDGVAEVCGAEVVKAGSTKTIRPSQDVWREDRQAYTDELARVLAKWIQLDSTTDAEDAADKADAAEVG